MRFYLDEDLSPRIADGLRRKGIDAISAFELGNTHVPDPEQLAYAAREGRCLITRNAREFKLLSEDAIRRQGPHSGIVLGPPSLRGSEIGPIIDALARLATRFPKGLGEYDVVYLDLGGRPSL